MKRVHMSDKTIFGLTNLPLPLERDRCYKKNDEEHEKETKNCSSVQIQAISVTLQQKKFL